MDLNIVWFVLIAVLYTGFFVLEGFDFGVGILLPFLGKTDTERRSIINTIGPHWDGNEVWLVTAGGATFAAFPHWYATLFSGFYLPLFLLLMALILRGVSFEFRSKDDNPTWRATWDWAIFTGSLVASILLGVAFANLLRGVPIDASMRYTGGFFNLLNPYALIAGVATVLVFILHGALFLSKKTTGVLVERAQQTARRTWLPALIALITLLIGTLIDTDLLQHRGVWGSLVVILPLAAILLTGYFIRRQRDGWAFVMTCLTVAFTVTAFFVALFPRVMVSSSDPAWSLTIYNAASGPYTLNIMVIVALIFTPFVLVYQGWSYWVFRKRVGNNPKTLTY
ncbi:MAG TPA: cytochrome d ubiquinol oxidase subunit II [Anaerolineales bacterium]|nr:cytochrome d ubiquinol oxidase subunit II [Anaerolineales bacterium]